MQRTAEVPCRPIPGDAAPQSLSEQSTAITTSNVSLTNIQGSSTGNSVTLESPITLQYEFKDGVEDCSWSDVMDSMSAASAEYKTRPGTNWLRKASRNKAIVVTLDSLVETIPEQDGLSVLRGGLKTIFKMLHRRIENGERILAAFEDIPITFSDACLALRAHPTDEALRTHVRDLFLTLRKEIPELRTVLLRKHQESLARRIFKQHPEAEANAITASLEAVDRAARRVTSRVNALASETSVQTFQQVLSVGDGVSKTQVELEKISDELSTLQLAQIEAETRNAFRHEQTERNLQTFVESISQTVRQQLEDSQSQFRQGFSGIQDKLLEQMKQDTDTTTTLLPPNLCYVQAPVVYSQVTSPSSILLSFDELYTLLDIRDPLFLIKDLANILRSSHALPKTALKRATWLLNVDRFRAWADTTHGVSGLILVNGHLSGLIVGKISALSVFAATLASLPQSLPDLIITSHYCGLHVSPRDAMAGPRGMLRSLIAQIIMVQRQNQIGTTIALDEFLLNDIAKQDVQGLCEVLRALLCQFPRGTTIFSVLDNISEFETSLYGWEAELIEIIRSLQFIVGQMHWGVTLKVLLTAPNRSISVYRQLDEADCISLSAGNMSSHAVQRRSLESDWQQAILPG